MDEFFRLLRGLASAYGRQLPQEAFEIWKIAVLDQFGPDRSIAALKLWIMGGKGMPTTGDIVSNLNPKMSAESAAAELSGRLYGAIARRGYTWCDTCRYDGHASISAAIMAEFGEGALRVVDSVGGWKSFCEQYGGENPTANRAQLRGAIEAAHTRQKIDLQLGVKYEPRAAIEKTASTGRLSDAMSI